MEPTQPSGLESDILQVVWENAPCSAATVREKLPRTLEDSTVRTLLRRLVDKGFLTYKAEGRTYLYEPAVRPEAAAARAVRGILDRFCNGSVEQLLVGLVDSRVVGRDELRAIANRIAKAKGESE